MIVLKLSGANAGSGEQPVCSCRTGWHARRPVGTANAFEMLKLKVSQKLTAHNCQVIRRLSGLQKFQIRQLRSLIIIIIIIRGYLVGKAVANVLYRKTHYTYRSS
jgi:hypothetical protein